MSSRASDRDPSVVENALQKMEGLLASLRDTPAKLRKKALTHVYLASLLGCTVSTIKRWLKLHESLRARKPQSDRFCDLYEEIAGLLAEHIGATQFKIASDPAHPQALKAAQYLLPKIDPWGWGSRGDTVEDTSEVADIPQEVFDALTADEREELASYQRTAEAADEGAEALLERVALRVSRGAGYVAGQLH